MGLSSKKSTTNQTTTNNSTATTTPNVPDWLLQPAQTVAGGLSKLLATNPSSFGPTESALQQQATTSAGNLTTSPYLDQAASQVNGIAPVQGQSLLDGLDKYYTPFKDQVLNPVLTDYDHQSGIVRAGQAAKEAASGSFRGSRSGIAEGATEGELARGRASTEGGLLSDMYGQATTLSGQDAARRQEAMTGNADRSMTGAGLLAGIGVDKGSQALANAQAQATQGAAQTGIDNSIAQAPLTTQAQLEGLLNGLDPSMYTGQTINSSGSGTMNGTTVTGSSGADMLADAAKIAAVIAMSDRRVKTDIRTVKYDARGHRWVTFAYLWAPLVRFYGLIAQEVRKIDPQAVLEGPGGILQVNYGAIG